MTTLETIIMKYSLDPALMDISREYPDPKVVRMPRLDWAVAVQILAATGASKTRAEELAALSIAEMIDGPFHYDYTTLDWVMDGDWDGTETEAQIISEWKEYTS